MKNKLNTYAMIGSVVAGAAVVAGMALPAFALTAGLGANINATAQSSGTASGTAGITIGAGLKASLGAKVVANIVNRADQEIARRLDALTALQTRINAMARLSADEKNNLASTIQSQITALDSLKAQIAADAQADSTTTLKADVQSITKSYRIFALVLPQGAIEAAADRALNLANTMQDLSTKLSVRLSAAQAAGNNVSASETVLTDMHTKITDASANAQAAVVAVSSLKPDNGDQTVMASNLAALKDARSKIQVAQQDFVAARKDAESIIAALAKFKGSANASTTVSSTASTSAQ